jgi:hypothetical protein
MRRLAATILGAFLAALILCGTTADRCVAQTNSASAANPSIQNAEPASQTSSTAPAEPAAKKVWTNDDVSGLRGDSAISTFTEPNAKAVKTGAKPASKGRDGKWYQNQITRLQAQIPPLDDQIGQLQAAIAGKPTGDSKESTRPLGVKADQWPVELDNLQKKRDDIETRINTLEDQARHDGVPPGALP